MYTPYLLIDIVYVYHSSHVNKYEANKINLCVIILFTNDLSALKIKQICTSVHKQLVTDSKHQQEKHRSH